MEQCLLVGNPITWDGGINILSVETDTQKNARLTSVLVCKKKMMIPLSERWLKELVEQPETGMGYQVVSIILKDGTHYDRVVIDSGFVTKIEGMNEITLKEEDIQQIIVTHDKWNFKHE